MVPLHPDSKIHEPGIKHKRAEQIEQATHIDQIGQYGNNAEQDGIEQDLQTREFNTMSNR